MGFYVLIYH